MENQGKNWIKIDDIGKENIYTTPDRYFDDLPLAIQTRISKQKAYKSVPVWNLALKYALPAVAIVVGLILWLMPPVQKSPENLLAQVEEASILEYLQNSDLTTEEILQSIESNSITVEWEDTNLLDHVEVEELNGLLEEYGIEDYIN